MHVGTPQHREIFCRTFIDTHRVYEPENLSWPRLEGHQLGLLRAFPFWSFAHSIEERAGRMVTAFSRTIADPLIREAVALQGFEEQRHGRLLAHVLDRYGIDAPRTPIPDAPAVRDDFLIFGFGECSDSFVGFGAFAIARRKQIFPQPLMDIFENILFEEARHITFFINWWRYEEALAGCSPPLRMLRALQYHFRAAKGTAEGAADVPKVEELTTGSSQAVLEGVTPAMFLAAALAENHAMMARLDRRLLKPRIVPALATAALLAIRMLPPRTPATAVGPSPRLVA